MKLQLVTDQTAFFELLNAVEQAIEIYKQPHYGDTDTALDNAYDAMELLINAVARIKTETKGN